MIVAAVMTFSAFLTVVVAWVRLKLRFACPWMSGDYEALEDSGTGGQADDDGDGSQPDGSAGALPTYEEAVYGHVGTPLPWGGRGPFPSFLSSHPEPCSPFIAPGGSPLPEEPPSYLEAMAAAFAEAHDLLRDRVPAGQAKEGCSSGPGKASAPRPSSAPHSLGESPLFPPPSIAVPSGGAQG